MHRLLAVTAVFAAAAAALGCSEPPAAPGAMTVPMSATEVRAEIDHVQRTTPLPSGATWLTVVLDDDGSYGPYAGGSMIEWQALCAWLNEARAAVTEGDATRLGAAAAVLHRVPSWRTFSDPEQTVGSAAELVRTVTADAAAGDLVSVEAFLEANCD